MQDQASTADPTQARRHRRVGLYLVAAVLLAVGVIYATVEWRKHSINRPVQAALAGEMEAKTAVYRRALIGGNDIVFDVQSVSGEMSMVDMTRRLLKTAEALRAHDFERVYLAYKGNEKFYLEGPYFKKLGEEREWQNPIYTIRSMPENVRNIDGSPAFETWTGGWLGVMGQQMEDNNEFHRKWWVNDALVDIEQ